MASAPLPVSQKLDAPELRALVQDVTRIGSMVLRRIGVMFPMATEEEADAIAAPAARLLARAPATQRVIRSIADPLVLTGAVLVLFDGNRFLVKRPSPPAPRPPIAQAPVVAADLGATVPVVDIYGGPDVQALREHILNGIARADVR